MIKAETLKRALETGHVRYKLTSVARGTEIAAGELAQVSPEELEALARDDAAPLSKDALHEYALCVESADGAKRTRMAIRVHGGKDRDAEHAVDVERTQSGAAVIGHLTRLVVEQNKVIAQLGQVFVARDTVREQELGKLRRAVVKQGDIEIVKMHLDQESEDRRAERERNRMLWEGLLGIAGPVLHKVLPGGPESALDKFRGSLTEAQCEGILAIIGAGRFARLMNARTPESVAELLFEVTKEEGAQLFALLNDEQQKMMHAALSAEMKKRAAAAEKEQANGVPS